MTRAQALTQIQNDLHISHSQISTWLDCPLLYRFRYVERRPPERVSIALPMGSAIHSAVELHYRTIKNHGLKAPIDALWERFETCLALELDAIEAPVIYKNGTPDRQSAIEMGKAMLTAFHAGTDLTGFEIVGVEVPLSATLYTEQGQPTDFKLVGIIDLILRHPSGRVLVVDNKTASKPMAQATADDDFQMTAYSYLLASNRYVVPHAQVEGRFDVLRKLKQPIVQTVQTVRTAQHRRRFAKLASQVLTAIDQRIYLPRPSWKCVDCAYANACGDW